MGNVSTWDVVAGNNSQTPPDGAPEGMARSATNDVMRENMAALAKWYGDTNGSLVTAGTADAYTLTTNSAHAALADLSLLSFRADRANTGAATLAVDGLAAKAVRKAGGAALVANDLLADRIYVVAYNATKDQFDMMTPAAGQRLIGEVIDYAGSTAPAGWLLCFGQAVSRTTYSALFAIASTTYGVGDGSTTFNVPDLRGRVVAGKDDMGGTSANRLTDATDSLNGDTLGDTGGVETTTKVANHRHYEFADSNVGTPSGGLSGSNYPARAASGSGSVDSYNISGTSSPEPTVGQSSNPITVGASAVAVVQPTIILNKIIYTGV